MESSAEGEKVVNPVLQVRLHNHAVFTRHWFNASGTPAYSGGLAGKELKRLVNYRRDFHKMLLPDADRTTVGIVDSMCEAEARREVRRLNDGEHYCGLCCEPMRADNWDAHRLTPTHSSIELDVQIIYALWQHIEEVRRRKYEQGEQI